MDKLLDTLNQYLAAAHTVVAKYGPQVWDATLQLVRMQSIFNLIALAFATAGCCLAAWFWHRFLQKRIAVQQGYAEWEMGYIAMIAPGIGLIMCMVGWCSSFSDWLGAFSPQLAVLYRIASKAGLL